MATWLKAKGLRFCTKFLSLFFSLLDVVVSLKRKKEKLLERSSLKGPPKNRKTIMLPAL